MLSGVFHRVIESNERRIGVTLDYAHVIADAGIGLMMRYGKVFSFLDPRKNLPADAYHAARIRGALAADCGTCVIAEINLAKNAGVDHGLIDAVLSGEIPKLPAHLKAVVALCDAVVKNRIDDADARASIIDAYGQKGLIELCYAMNGAALLPGIKRGMGYATSCDLSVLKIKAQDK